MTNLIKVNEAIHGDINLHNVVDSLFNELDKKLLDYKEIALDLSSIGFVSVYFLERIVQFVTRAKDLNANIKIINLSPSIYKVFHVARVQPLLDVC